MFTSTAVLYYLSGSTVLWLTQVTQTADETLVAREITLDKANGNPQAIDLGTGNLLPSFDDNPTALAPSAESPRQQAVEGASPATGTAPPPSIDTQLPPGSQKMVAPGGGGGGKDGAGAGGFGGAGGNGFGAGGVGFTPDTMEVVEAILACGDHESAKVPSAFAARRLSNLNLWTSPELRSALRTVAVSSWPAHR